MIRRPARCRRTALIQTLTALALIACPAPALAAPAYGLIGAMLAQPGKRDALIAILAEGTVRMAGCRAYIIARDAKEPNRIWITEAWDSKAAHDASLALPAVRAAIARGRPLIAGFGDQVEIEPISALPRP